jgi:uncharacterized protein
MGILRALLFNTTGKYRAKRQFGMPVRSLNSLVFKWPDLKTVDEAVRTWAASMADDRPGVLRLGYFGSYARGDWGVGSDLDLVAIVTGSSEPFERRSLAWDLNTLPVPAELLIYTLKEWKALLRETSRFARTLERETVWIFDNDRQEKKAERR